MKKTLGKYFLSVFSFTQMFRQLQLSFFEQHLQHRFFTLSASSLKRFLSKPYDRERTEHFLPCAQGVTVTIPRRTAVVTIHKKILICIKTIFISDYPFIFDLDCISAFYIGQLSMIFRCDNGSKRLTEYRRRGLCLTQSIDAGPDLYKQRAVGKLLRK